MDRSLLDPDFPRASRGGWSCVSVDLHGASQDALYGPLPTTIQEIGLAELCLRHCQVPLAVVADFKATIDCLAVGRARFCSPSSVYSGTWENILFKTNVIGIDALNVVWAPAHKSWAEARARGVARLHYRGHRLAHHFARPGAGKHPRDAESCRRRGLAWWAACHVPHYA